MSVLQAGPARRKDCRKNAKLFKIVLDHAKQTNYHRVDWWTNQNRLGTRGEGGITAAETLKHHLKQNENRGGSWVLSVWKLGGLLKEEIGNTLKWSSKLNLWSTVKAVWPSCTRITMKEILPVQPEYIILTLNFLLCIYLNWCKHT